MTDKPHRPGFGPNSFWIVEKGGEIVEKKAVRGLSALLPIERLVYFLWIADSCRRGDGDIEQGDNYHQGFKLEAAQLAGRLGCPLTAQCFNLADADFVSRYYGFFDGVCDELKLVLN